MYIIFSFRANIAFWMSAETQLKGYKWLNCILLPYL